MRARYKIQKDDSGFYCLYKREWYGWRYITLTGTLQHTQEKLLNLIQKPAYFDKNGEHIN